MLATMTSLLRLLNQSVDVLQQCYDKRSCLVVHPFSRACLCHIHVVCTHVSAVGHLMHRHLSCVCVPVCSNWYFTLPTSGLAYILLCSHVNATTQRRDLSVFSGSHLYMA